MVGKSVVPTIVKRYTEQRHRGTNGFGFYVPEKNKLTHNVREGRILSLLKRNDDATEIMFHHRIPTSTVNVRNACHPFSTKDYFENQYIVIHNGVLHNEDELKKEHDKLGIEYVSMQENGRYNDSEALTYDLARYFEGQVDTLTARGSIAFIAVKRDKDGKPICLFFGRNYGNPLKMKKTKFSLTLSSEGKGDDVEANQLYCFNYDTLELTKRPLTIPGAYYAPRTYTPASYAHTHSTTTKVDDVVKRGSDSGWDDKDDVAAMEDYWVEKSEIQQLKAGILSENDYDYLDSIGVVNAELDRLRVRNEQLDQWSQMSEEELEKEELTLEDADVNEFIENEDKIHYLEIVVKELREDYARRLSNGIERRKDAQKSIGFHFTPDSGQTYPVPQLPSGEEKKDSDNKTLGEVVRDKVAERAKDKPDTSCYPWSD